MLKINDWLQQIHFYHSIYYELKKIKKIFQCKFILIPNFKLKNLLKHLEDISNILDNL
ncbi:hypothetical protein ['Camptotheca acuminata' phytoplasma]|uniref:hypothetical protein n=1 Tax='Camptotheca acuminata' phytoplasma TaxID=3239192 RepID=UPI00351A2E2D